jgi:hypothetical protein
MVFPSNSGQDIAWLKAENKIPLSKLTRENDTSVWAHDIKDATMFGSEQEAQEFAQKNQELWQIIFYKVISITEHEVKVIQNLKF